MSYQVLLTYFGTVVYFDRRAERLRHAAPGEVEANVAVSQADGRIMLCWLDGAEMRPLGDFGPERCALAANGAAAAALTMVPAGADVVGLGMNGRFLCAEADGGVTLSRPHINVWEQFRLLDRGDLALLAGGGGVAATVSPTRPHVSINAIGEALHPLAAVLRDSFAAACVTGPTLDPELLAMQGMSGWRYRQFINALVRAVPDARYLEVGSWMGSTLCSAIAGNRVRAMAIDNWSEYGGPVREFFANVSRYLGPDNAVSVLNTDFRTAPFGAIGTHNIYLFDGPHLEQDQYDGIGLALPALDADFVLVVDDWNWEAVRSGTFRALRALGLAVALSIEVRSSLDNSHPQLCGPESEWHNGYFIAAVSKPPVAA